LVSAGWDLTDDLSPAAATEASVFISAVLVSSVDLLSTIGLEANSNKAFLASSSLSSSFTSSSSSLLSSIISTISDELSTSCAIGTVASDSSPLLSS